MTWDAIEQPPTSTKRKPTPVSVSIKVRCGYPMFNATISAALVAQLGWQPEERLQLLVGQDRHAGMVRVVPHALGRKLRSLPKGTYFAATLVPGDHLARWETPQAEATFMVLPAQRTLEITLPWDLSGEPTAVAEAEAA